MVEGKTWKLKGMFSELSKVENHLNWTVVEEQDEIECVVCRKLNDFYDGSRKGCLIKDDLKTWNGCNIYNWMEGQKNNKLYKKIIRPGVK